MTGRRKISGAILPGILLSLAVIAGPALAAPPPWEITADSMVHLNDPDSIVAEGNVIVIKPKSAGPASVFIRADWARYDLALGTIKARGNVRIISGSDEITAESAELDLAAETGSFTDSTIFMAESHMYVAGAEVQKTGPFSYTMKKGWATACKPEEGKSPPWSFTSSSTNLTMDGMATMTNAVFHVKNTPLAYTPVLIFPAKTKRESGVLFPEWSHSSRNGFGLTVPIFLNASPSTDFTLYPGYLAERGALYGGEFRYVRAPESKGNFLVNYLRDQLDDGKDPASEYKGDGLVRREQNRYWIRGKADHDFGNELKARLDLDLVSDQDYLQEFKDGAAGYTASRLMFLDEFGRDIREETITERESSLQFIKSWPSMVATAELRTRQESAHDLRVDSGGYSFLPRTSSPLQALPRLDFAGRLPLGRSGVNTAWETEYVNYWRKQGVGAQRIDLHPKLISFLPKNGWVEGRLSGGVRETAYQMTANGDSSWELDTFQDRQAFDFTGNIATLLMREFAFGRSGWLEHLIRPNLVYEYLDRNSELPSLDNSSGTDLYFDNIDRLERKNWLTWQLNNYFTTGGVNDKGGHWHRSLGLIKILQTRDLRGENPDSMGLPPGSRRYDWSDLRLETAMSPTPNWVIGYQTNLSMYGKGITRYELLNSYSLAGHSLGLNYRYLKDSGMIAPYFYTDLGESSHDLIATLGLRLTDTLSAKGYLVQSFSEDHTVESRARLIYQPACWMMEIETTRTTDDRRVMVIFSLDGIGRALRFGRDL